jgi:hypothetical protein
MEEFNKEELEYISEMNNNLDILADEVIEKKSYKRF